jgi:broad specificity phosphatase PhoE
MTGSGAAVTVVYLIRHGRTGLNAAGLLRGRVDMPLDEAGRAEADRLGALFGGVRLAAVLSSPLRRAVQTAEPVAASTGAPLRQAEAFLDRDYGPWNGRPQAEAERAHGCLDAAPGVEPRTAFQGRVLAGLGAAVAEQAGRAFAVVAHEAVNRTLLALLDGRLGDPDQIPQRTGCWNRLRHAGGRWQVLVMDAVPGDGHRPG